DEACLTQAVAIGSAADFASPGIVVQVAENSSTTIWATASDELSTSTCSTTFATYVQRPAPPDPPVFTGSDPDSPANDNVPFIKGSALAGSIVRLYTNASCAGPRAVEGTAAAFASPGIQISVLNDATTTIYGTLTSAAGST